MEAHEVKAIFAIADRVIGIVKGADQLTVALELMECHNKVCPLKLEALAEADDFNLMHDVSGIFRHMDSKAGKLNDCFLPRYADIRRMA